MIGTRFKVAEEGRTFPITRFCLSSVQESPCLPETAHHWGVDVIVFGITTPNFCLSYFPHPVTPKIKISHPFTMQNNAVLCCWSFGFYVLLHFVYPLNGQISISVLK